MTGSGVLSRNENSVLAVGSEKLTFNIKDFPQFDGDGLKDYKSTVTADYNFINTSDKTVRTSMAFPAGNVPDYFYNYETDTADVTELIAPLITVDGRQVETKIRYTYGNYNNYADFAEGVAKISDEWHEDDFYKPDMPVTAYAVKADRGKYSDIKVSGKVSCDKSKARYSCGNGSDNEMNFYFYRTGTSYEELVNGGQYVFYVIGDKSGFSVEWTVYEEIYREGNFFTGSSTELREVDIPVEVTELTYKDGTPLVATLKDLILSKRQAGSMISDLDYYNAMSAYLIGGDDINSAYACDFRHLSSSDGAFCMWYTYDVEVEPHGSFKNVVTAPLFPTVNYNYSPNVYEYEYYLSPARGWADFGNLQIDINSEAYFIGNSLPAFDSGNGGWSSSEGQYHAAFSTLPEGELRFSLCSVADPSYDPPGHGTPAVIMFVILGIVLLLAVAAPVAGVIMAIVYLVHNRKK